MLNKCWKLRLELSLLSLEPKQSLIFSPVIKQFSACNRLTWHCAVWCTLCAVFTVQRGALYSLQWCAVYGVQCAVVCAARPLHIPNFCGGQDYIGNVHYCCSLPHVLVGVSYCGWYKTTCLPPNPAICTQCKSLSLVASSSKFHRLGFPSFNNITQMSASSKPTKCQGIKEKVKVILPILPK